MKSDNGNRPTLRDFEDFICAKADFIGVNKSKFKDCYNLGTILG